jgi:hypothetical protein
MTLEQIEQDITMTQNRIIVKEAYLPALEKSDLTDEMKLRYHNGILQEYTLLATLQVMVKRQSR